MLNTVWALEAAQYSHSNVETTQSLLLHLCGELKVNWPTLRFVRVASYSLGLIAHHRHRTDATMAQLSTNELLEIEKMIIVDAWNLFSHEIGKPQEIFDIVTGLEVSKKNKLNYTIDRFSFFSSVQLTGPEALTICSAIDSKLSSPIQNSLESVAM